MLVPIYKFPTWVYLSNKNLYRSQSRGLEYRVGCWKAREKPGSVQE